MLIEPDYLTHARNDIGVREIKGSSHSARIQSMLSKVKAWWKDDETPWCGTAVGAWLSECGHAIPLNAFRAKSWVNYGNKCGFCLGAIVVLERKGGGHIGLLTGISEDRKMVKLLGGNQNDRVCEAWFETSRIVACRLPLGVPQYNVPVWKVGNLSTSEV